MNGTDPRPDDPRDLELPARWREWPVSGKREYVLSNLSRDDLFRIVVLECDVSGIEPEDVQPTSRFNKNQLADIAFRVGAFR